MSKILLAAALTFYSITSLAGTANAKVFTNTAEYNAEQDSRRNSFKITQRQNGDSCVCHSILNISNALNNTNHTITPDQEKNCWGNFTEQYSLFSEKQHKGQLFGGAINHLRGQKGVSGKKPLAELSMQ